MLMLNTNIAYYYYLNIVNPHLLVLNEILTIHKMHIYILRSNETTCLIDTFIWHPPLSAKEYDKIFFLLQEIRKKETQFEIGIKTWCGYSQRF